MAEPGGCGGRFGHPFLRDSSCGGRFGHFPPCGGRFGHFFQCGGKFGHFGKIDPSNVGLEAKIKKNFASADIDLGFGRNLGKGSIALKTV